METISSSDDVTSQEKTALHILKHLDAPLRKTDTPHKPLIIELFGDAKSGKDTQTQELDRWFRRRGFKVLVHQESAETKEIRTMSRSNTYLYEMCHFAYNFSNLLSATCNRDFHLIILNRGIVDTLVWLEWHKKRGTIPPAHIASASAFIEEGPWLQCLDSIFYLTCDLNTCLEREYHTSSKTQYGSRMNPEHLSLMQDCANTVALRLMLQFPTLPLLRRTTTHESIAETRDAILNFFINEIKQKAPFNAL